MPDDRGPSRSQIPFMLLSAGIFAYFGFVTTWLYTGVNGQFLLFVALLDWTLKITAVGFAVCAVIAFFSAFVGNLLYSLIGLLSAVMFLLVAILDFMDTQHTAMHPLLLLIFAGWNGYGSWIGFQETLGGRVARDDRDSGSSEFRPPPS